MQLFRCFVCSDFDAAVSFFKSVTSLFNLTVPRAYAAASQRQLLFLPGALWHANAGRALLFTLSFSVLL